MLRCILGSLYFGKLPSRAALLAQNFEQRVGDPGTQGEDLASARMRCCSETWVFCVGRSLLIIRISCF